MRISVWRHSDRLALWTGDPHRISVTFSADPHAVAATLARCAPDERKTVLLLGANGFIGMHVLRELLDDARIGRVYALVRGNERTSGAERLARQLRKYRMTLPARERLTVHQADFTEPSMGLDGARYAELRAEVDAIVDATGATNHTYPYAWYRKEKMGPVLDLVDFCYQERHKSLHIIGSVGSEVYKRQRDFFRYSFFHCGYSKMKWVIKHLGLHARRQGVPLFTYQAPFVLGGPHTGYRDPGMQYSFWHMIWYTLQTGQIWASDHRIPVVSADVLARAVVTNMCAEKPQDVVYPVTPVTTEEIAARFGLDVVPWPEFRRNLTRRFGAGPRDVNWAKPWSSARRAVQHALFARSLFPRSLPTILKNIDVTAPPMTGPMAGRIPPIEVVVESAKQIRKIRRDLPVESPVEMVKTDDKAA
jgi:nucleoside-diphosphate-sugar epimerase